MAHKLTTPAILGTVLTGIDTAPVNVVGIGPGQSQLVVSDSNYFLFIHLCIMSEVFTYCIMSEVFTYCIMSEVFTYCIMSEVFTYVCRILSETKRIDNNNVHK